MSPTHLSQLGGSPRDHEDPVKTESYLVMRETKRVLPEAADRISI